MKQLLFTFAVVFAFSACHGGEKRPPVAVDKYKYTDASIRVDYSERNGVKILPVKVNGVSMDMVYDPGCSGMNMSMMELQMLYKNGELSQDDFIGFSASKIADGSIVEDMTILIRKVEIGGKDGIVIRNVEATVASNLDAPVLLGNAVLDKVASVEVDNIEKVIKFKKR